MKTDILTGRQHHPPAACALAVSARRWFERPSLILYHTQPPPTRRTTRDMPHVAPALYLPRITQAVVGAACWVVDRWPVWVKVISRGGQLWVQVVGSAGGRAGTLLDGLGALSTVSLRDILLSAAGTGGWGQRTCVDRCSSWLYIYYF